MPNMQTIARTRIPSAPISSRRRGEGAETRFAGRRARPSIFAGETSNDRFGFLYELPSPSHRAAALVHEDQPPARLNGRCRFSRGTFAGTRGNGRDAPKAVGKRRI